MESDTENTRQIIRIASLDEAGEKPALRLSAFVSPCRLLCGKGEETGSACIVHEKLQDHLSCCADKAATLIRAHPLKSMAVTGMAAFLIGRYFSRKP